MTMNDFFEKKIKTEKIFRFVTIGLLIMFVVSLFIVSHIDVKTPELIIVFLVTAMLVCTLIYFGLFFPFLRNLRWLRKNGIENISHDINLNKPTLPRSKIYCGERALLTKRPCLLIPYNEMGWVYIYKKYTNGFLTERSFIIYTKDKHKFSLAFDDEDEIRWLLNNYIIKNSPDVIIGYGKEQKERYKKTLH